MEKEREKKDNDDGYPKIKSFHSALKVRRKYLLIA
jgi:hypothetical protein